MDEAKFAMAFHCNQPVFNFEDKIEEAYKNAYLPLLETLEEFSGIKVSFHYSGNMLEWFKEKHPEYIEKVSFLVRRGQIELISGGCFDPVMVLIPERDRRGQLRMNGELIEEIFAVKPKGAWIAERVWEPSLVDTLSDAGIKYTIVDDCHILKAGAGEERLFTPCLTQGKDSSVILFPSLRILRYFIPFRMPQVTLDYVKEVAGKRNGKNTCFFFADDGEKFGVWPHTHRWVYKRGWLRSFFRLLEENARWFKTVTYSEIVDTVPAERIEEVPAASYAEMMEWSGGNFKNFLEKYPEADRMHKRMISVSDAVEEMRMKNSRFGENSRIDEAKKELFKAQSSCAYWHGAFGGVYLPHLRSGVYSHLIKAGEIIEKLQQDRKSGVRSMECDLGRKGREIVTSNRFIDIFIKSFAGAAVSELDYKPLGLNLANTISRVREAYHSKLDRTCSERAKQIKEIITKRSPVNIHDLLGLGERGLRRVLGYDDYQRGVFLTHIYPEKKAWRKMDLAGKSHDGFLKGSYEAVTETEDEAITHAFSRRERAFSSCGSQFDLEIEKKITLGLEAAIHFSHKIKCYYGRGILRYALEFNFLVWDSAVIPGPRFLNVEHFALKDKYSGLGLSFSLGEKRPVFMYPVYTVNETECGLKKTFQGVSVLIGGECDFDDACASDELKVTVTIG